MIWQLTENPAEVIDLATGETVPEGHRRWQEFLDSVVAGVPPRPVPPPYVLHSPQHYQAIRAAAWNWMTAFVKDRRYDNIETCASYYNSGVERYRLEARALVAWRDDVNQALEQLVLNPPEGIETWDEVRALLPQPEAYPWPGAVELPLGVGESALPVALP